jgi:hypothetical protein
VSIYTLKGSTELDARIDIHLEHIVKTVSPHCDAVILLGGYGRGEGTPFIKPDGAQAPFNDYDLVVIVDTVNKPVRLYFQSLEQQLSEDLGLPVDLCPYQHSQLSSREFSLLNYEMKYGHKVLWGDDHTLDAMPNYTLDSIPLSEGSRLLLNRGKLLLDIQQRLTEPNPQTAEERIRFIKFIFKVKLAFGDCALLAARNYDIFYSVKKARIADIQACPDRDAVISGYLRAIELREWGDFQALDDFDEVAEFEAVRDIFLRFLPWYRAQYSARECSVSKAIALNLKWNGCFAMQHPRVRLYDAIHGLLQGDSDYPVEKFYALQRRFS